MDLYRTNPHVLLVPENFIVKQDGNPFSCLNPVFAQATPETAIPVYQARVGLGTLAPVSAAAGTTITNTGASVLAGDLVLSPGAAVVGFPPGTVNGIQNVNNAAAIQAKADLVTAYTEVAARTGATVIPAEAGLTTLTPGLYSTPAALGVTAGDFTLDAEGDPNAVFIFQIGTALTLSGGNSIVLINGANADNIFFQVGSSATIGAASDFFGTILALTSITGVAGANITGRLLARNGAVTLDTNDVSNTVPSAAPTPGVPSYPADVTLYGVCRPPDAPVLDNAGSVGYFGPSPSRLPKHIRIIADGVTDIWNATDYPALANLNDDGGALTNLIRLLTLLVVNGRVQQRVQSDVLLAGGDYRTVDNGGVMQIEARAVGGLVYGAGTVLDIYMLDATDVVAQGIYGHLMQEIRSYDFMTADAGQVVLNADRV